MVVQKNNWAASDFGKHVSPDLVEERFLDVEIVILLQGNNLFGDLVYSYVQLKGKDLKEMFAKMQSGENFKPSDFGTVLSAGRGDPPREVREEMATNYHMIDIPAPKTAPQVFVQPKFFGDEGE